MVQGGDPTGSGKGGQSIYGKPFADEVRGTLKVSSLLHQLQFDQNGEIDFWNSSLTHEES